MVSVAQCTRYVVEPKKKQAVSVKPPFLRPDLSERQITVKISDNGIQANLNRSKVRESPSSAFGGQGLSISKPGNESGIDKSLRDGAETRVCVLVMYFML